MLVTFSVHGGAATLAAFRQDEFLQTYSRYQTRTNRQVRLRNRFRVDAEEAKGYTVQSHTWNSGKNGQERCYTSVSVTSSSLHLREAVVDSVEGDLIKRYAALNRGPRRDYLNHTHLDVGRHAQEAPRKRLQVLDQTSDYGIQAQPSYPGPSTLSHHSPAHVRCQPPVGIDPRLLTKSYTLPALSVDDTNKRLPTSDHSIYSSFPSQQRDNIGTCQALVKAANSDTSTQVSEIPLLARLRQTRSSNMSMDMDNGEVTDHLSSHNTSMSMTKKRLTTHPTHSKPIGIVHRFGENHMSQHQIPGGQHPHTVHKSQHAQHQSLLLLRGPATCPCNANYPLAGGFRAKQPTQTPNMSGYYGPSLNEVARSRKQVDGSQTDDQIQQTIDPNKNDSSEKQFSEGQTSLPRRHNSAGGNEHKGSECCRPDWRESARSGKALPQEQYCPILHPQQRQNSTLSCQSCLTSPSIFKQRYPVNTTPAGKMDGPKNPQIGENGSAFRAPLSRQSPVRNQNENLYFIPGNQPYPLGDFITVTEGQDAEKIIASFENMAPPSPPPPEHIAAAQMFPGLPPDEARLGFLLDQELKQTAATSKKPEDVAPVHSQVSRSHPVYTHRPASVVISRQPTHVLVIHDFIKKLPADQPSPFNQEIFVDSEDYSYSNGSKFRSSGEGIKYKNFNVYNTYQILKLPNDGGEIGGLCTVYTRKFPRDYEHLPHMHLQQPAKKIGTTDVDSVEARKRYKPQEPIIWQYSTTAHMEGQWYRVDAPVQARVVHIDGVSCDVEPVWNDVVAALKAEMTRREMTFNLPVNQKFKANERVADTGIYPRCQISQPNEKLIRPFGGVEENTSQYNDRPTPSGWKEPSAHSGHHTSYQTLAMHQHSPRFPLGIANSSYVPHPTVSRDQDRQSFVLGGPSPLQESPQLPQPSVPISTQRSYSEMEPQQVQLRSLAPTMQAIAPEAKKRRRDSAAPDDDGNPCSMGKPRKKSTPSTNQQSKMSQSMGGSSHSVSYNGGGGDGWQSARGYQPQQMQQRMYQGGPEQTIQQPQSPGFASPYIAPQQGHQQMSQQPLMGDRSFFQKQEAHQTSRNSSTGPQAFSYQEPIDRVSSMTPQAPHQEGIDYFQPQHPQYGHTGTPGSDPEALGSPPPSYNSDYYPPRGHDDDDSGRFSMSPSTPSHGPDKPTTL